MDPSLLTLFVTLKGLTPCSKLFNVPESILAQHLLTPGSYTSPFFCKVLECIQSLLQTTSLSNASEYFALPTEFIKSLSEPSSQFLVFAHEQLSRPLLRFCEKAVQTDPEFVLPAFNLRSVTDIVNSALNSAPRIQNSNSAAKGSDLNSTAKGSDLNSAARVSDLNLAPKVSSNVVVGSVPSEVERSHVTDVIKKNQQPPIRKFYSLTSLQEHKPLSGSIINPDYSYNPMRS